MARIEQIPSVNLEVRLILTEAEVGALDALAGYGTDGFLKVFYEHMGESYMKPYEKGLRSLFATARGLKQFVDRANEARMVFDGRYVVRNKAHRDAENWREPSGFGWREEEGRVYWA